MAEHGVDSQIGRTAAVMLGSTETTFYTISVYFGAAGIQKTRYTLIAAIVDLLGDVTKKLTNVEDTTIAISDELDEIEEDLDAIEDFIMDEDDDDDYDDEDDYDDYDDEDFDEEGFDFGDEDTTIYEVKCVCGNVIAFDEETLDEGSIICDECGETLEFSFEDEDEDEE